MLLLIIILTNFLFSQNLSIDSLKNLLKKDLKDTPRVKLNIVISHEYSFSEPDSGIVYGKEALKLANNIKWSPGICEAYKNLGLNYSLKSDFPKSIDYYFKALKIADSLDSTNVISKIYSDLGTIYFDLGDFDKADEFMNKALEINLELNSLKDLANNYTNLGILYLNKGDYKKGIEYLENSVEIDEKLGNRAGISSNLTNIASAYSLMKNQDKAIEYYELSLVEDRKQKSYEGMAINLVNIAENIMTKYRDNERQKDSKIILFNKENDFKKAEAYLEEGISIFEQIGKIDYQRHAVWSLSKFYQSNRDFEKALKTYKLFIKLTDSINNIETKKQIANLEAKRENELKAKQIQVLTLEKKNQFIIAIALSIGIFLTIIALILIIKQRNKAEKLLLNILPKPIAKRLKAKEHPIADYFDNVSVIFLDIVNFTSMSEKIPPKDLLILLNSIFTKLDKLILKYGLEKIKTIGDAYMAVSGLPIKDDKQIIKIVQVAYEIKGLLAEINSKSEVEINLRIGLNTGPVIAGVIGESKFIYDLWGDTVNTASRMESYGIPGEIQITENFKNELLIYQDHPEIPKFEFVSRGEIEVKGKGKLNTFLLKFTTQEL